MNWKCPCGAKYHRKDVAKICHGSEACRFEAIWL